MKNKENDTMPIQENDAQKVKNNDEKDREHLDKTVKDIADNNKFKQQQKQEKTTSQNEPKKKPELTNSILASKHDKISMKIAKLEDKNTMLKEKIKKQDNRIDTLKSKKTRATETAEYCEALIKSSVLPAPVNQFLKSLAESKRAKATAIDKKIAVKQNKNNDLHNKISKNDVKIKKQTKKANRIERIDKFLTNMQSKDGRKENFVEGLQEFRKWSLERNQNKLEKLDKKIADIEKALSSETILSTENIKLNNILETYQVNRENIEEKIKKLNSMNENLKAVDLLPNDKVKQAITAGCENITNVITDNQLTVAQTVDTVLDTANETIETLLEKIQNLENKIDNLENSKQEQQIINNEKQKSIEDKLKIDIENDVIMYGEITLETATAIKQAGYLYENGNLQPAVTELSSQEIKSAAEKSESTKFVDKSDKPKLNSQTAKKAAPLSKTSVEKSAKIIAEKSQQQEHNTPTKSKNNELS